MSAAKKGKTTAKAKASKRAVTDDELAGPVEAPVGLSETEVDAFAPFVDASGTHFQSPPPSPRHLGLFRHLSVIRDHSIGGSERWYLIAVADVSQLPASRYAGTNTFLAHLANLLSDALQRADVIKPGHSRYGCAAIYTLTAKTRARAERIAAAFSRRPIFARPLGPLTLFGAAGLIAANLYDDALALTPALLEEGSEPSLDLAARAWLGAARASDGLVSLRPRIGKPEALTSIPLLKNSALLATRGLAPELAIALLARAFKLDANPQLRAWAVDEPTFEPLRPNPNFRALFRGFPAFEARLR